METKVFLGKKPKNVSFNEDGSVKTETTPTLELSTPMCIRDSFLAVSSFALNAITLGRYIAFAAPCKMCIRDRINEGRLGSNQQDNREKGFRKYMQEHFPDCKIVELNLYAKRPDEDEACLLYTSRCV